MKTRVRWLMFLPVFLVIFAGRAHAGIIPYSLIENGETAETKAPSDNLKDKHSEILKKIKELQHQEKQYLNELEELDKNYCK